MWCSCRFIYRNVLPKHVLVITVHRSRLHSMWKFRTIPGDKCMCVRYFEEADVAVIRAADVKGYSCMCTCARVVRAESRRLHQAFSHCTASCPSTSFLFLFCQKQKLAWWFDSSFSFKALFYFCMNYLNIYSSLLGKGNINVVIWWVLVSCLDLWNPDTVVLIATR